MAQFDENKVINVLHTEKAEIGKEYWYADNLLNLKRLVEENAKNRVGKLDRVLSTCLPFGIKDGEAWQFLYPHEEPSKQRMTKIQLMEWLAKGNGTSKYKGDVSCVNWTTCIEEVLNEEVDEDIVIRSWDSEEWIEPTYEIYLRDCKGVTQDDIDDVAYRDGC